MILPSRKSTCRLLQRLSIFAGLIGVSLQSPASSSSAIDASVTYRYDISAKGCCTLIAHAGGAIDGNPYTNSSEALLLSIKGGFRLIEVDFSKTSDGFWIAAHDWEYWAAHTGYEGALPPTINDVLRLQAHFKADRSVYGISGTYSILPLQNLLDVLVRHPSVKIVTDTKSSAAAFDLIRTLKGTSVFQQFIFQMYSLEDIEAAVSMVPEDQLILTTYQLRDWWAWDGFDQSFLTRLAEYPQLFALTIPLATSADSAKMDRLREALVVPLLLHGEPSQINSRNLHTQVAGWGVNGLYVD